MHNKALICFIISVVFFFIATSCNTERRLQKAEVLLASKGRLAEVCALRFPPKDSVVYRDSVKFDTLYEGIYSIDTVYDKDTVKVYVTLPAKVITKEVVRFRDVYRENTARVKELQDKNSECAAKNADLEKQITKLKVDLSESKGKARTYFWLFWLLILLALFITFRKTILKLAKIRLGLPI